MDKVILFCEEQSTLDKMKSQLDKYKGQFEVLAINQFDEIEQILSSKKISVLVLISTTEVVEDNRRVIDLAASHSKIPSITIFSTGENIEEIRQCRNIFKCLPGDVAPDDLASAIIEGLDIFDEGLFWKK